MISKIPCSYCGQSIPEPVTAGILRLIRERDEARKAARDLLVILQGYRPTGQSWGEKYPWLKEEAPPECI